jgi:hypothetical protein
MLIRMVLVGYCFGILSELRLCGTKQSLIQFP